jgi:cell division protein FtsB
MSFWKYLAKCTVYLVSGILLMALFLLFVPQYRKHAQQEQRLRELRAEKRREESSLNELRVRQEQFQTNPDYVKKVAHEIGMVTPDEVIFKFHDAEARFSHRDAN